MSDASLTRTIATALPDSPSSPTAALEIQTNPDSPPSPTASWETQPPTDPQCIGGDVLAELAELAGKSVSEVLSMWFSSSSFVGSDFALAVQSDPPSAWLRKRSSPPRGSQSMPQAKVQKQNLEVPAEVAAGSNGGESPNGGNVPRMSEADVVRKAARYVERLEPLLAPGVREAPDFYIVLEAAAKLLRFIRFDILDHNATEGRVLAHAMDVISRVGGHFKVGLTIDPARRWTHPSFGYAHDRTPRWARMEIVYCTSTRAAAGMLEAALIAVSKNKFGSFCLNEKLGGEGKASVANFCFVYVVS